MLDHPHLVVGHVLELPLAADVAEREHPADGGLLEGVDDQAAVLVAGQPGGRHVEKVGVDDPPDREEHRVGLDPARLATLGRRRERPTASVVPGLGDGRAQPDVVPGLGDLGVGAGDRLVLSLEQSFAAVDPGDVAAEALEDVRELRRDEPTARR